MSPHPLRVLVVLPSWVGDAVMATPALRLLRDAMPGALIGGLMRPGVVGVLADAGGDKPLIDEVHIARPTGVLGPKLTGFKLRPMKYETAILLTNSFSTALSVRVAGIERRVGYDRDVRGALLTDRVKPQRLADGSWTIVPAVRSYVDLARYVISGETPVSMPEMTSNTHADLGSATGLGMELGTSAADESAAESALAEAGIDGPFCLMIPGGNNPAKRWPADRFSAVARELASRGIRSAVSGSPEEREVLDAVAAGSGGAGEGAAAVVSVPTIGGVKALCRRACLMVANDTGPRHFAAAFGTPVVSLFGPTDPRWTTIPVRTLTDGSPAERVVVADPSLPASESSNDHAERCRVDRIGVDRVISAAVSLLEACPPDHRAAHPQE